MMWDTLYIHEFWSNVFYRSMNLNSDPIYFIDLWIWSLSPEPKDPIDPYKPDMQIADPMIYDDLVWKF